MATACTDTISRKSEEETRTNSRVCSLSIYLSAYPSIYLSTCLSISVYVCLSVYLIVTDNWLEKDLYSFLIILAHFQNNLNIL